MTTKWIWIVVSGLIGSASAYSSLPDNVILADLIVTLIGGFVGGGILGWLIGRRAEKNLMDD